MHTQENDFVSNKYGGLKIRDKTFYHYSLSYTMVKSQTRSLRKGTTKRAKTIKKKVFKNRDFKSGDGMLTSIWGPSMWHVLHTVSFNYPVTPTQTQKKQYRSFVLNLRHILPCKYCRMNLRENFKALPLTMEHMKNRDTFSKYIYRLHELINKMLKKKSGLKYCDVRERYEHFRARCSEKSPQQEKTVNKKKESGCTEPLHGEKSKCILHIVPKKKRCKTFKIEKKCLKRRKTKRRTK